MNDATRDSTTDSRETSASPLSHRRKRLVALLALAVVLSAGCATVKPYERGRLAHPTMTPGDLTGVGEGHLRAISEGAIGGAEGAGSGCGCN